MLLVSNAARDVLPPEAQLAASRIATCVDERVLSRHMYGSTHRLVVIAFVLGGCGNQPAASGGESGSEGGASSGSSSPADDAGQDTQQDPDGSSDGTGGGETGTSDGGSDGADDGGGWDPTAIPTPTAPCPDLQEGWNTFCPSGIEVCRDAYVVRGSGTGGPVNLYWHGLYQNAIDVQGFGAGQAVSNMTLAENGLAFFPSADPDALDRPGLPYPWWIVGDYMTSRKDDYFFLDEMIACAAESGDFDMDRINVGGMSAGGILTSHLVFRRGYWASAVSWSGGWTVPFEISAPTPTMVLHGGPNDCAVGYCGFMNASEFFAEQLVEQGAFAFLCDHSMGDASANHHTDAMGLQGAEFMSLAVRGETHPWDGYPFGTGGNYMLDNYCYAPGDESPWAPWD